MSAPRVFVNRYRYREGKCERQRCGVKRDVMVVWHVRPAGEWERDRYDLYVYARTVCVNAAKCKARREKGATRTQQRSARLVLEEPGAPDAPRGTCRWCGAAIYRRDQPDVLDRRRSYHYGPNSFRYSKTEGWHPGSPDEPDCYVAWCRSYTYDARVAVRRVHGTVCVDCGVECEPEDNNDAVPWDADHEVPLEDGGEHTLDNLRCRCVPCHKAKTAREARERAERRRPQLSL